MAKLPEAIDALSDDAKAVAGAWFSMMEPGRCTGLNFAMIEYRPSDRSQAALDELLSAGLVDKTVTKAGAVNYVPLISFRPLLAWMHQHEDDPSMRFRLVVPLKD